MFSAIGRATTIVALCLSLGLHWLALQSIAWTTMLVENARQVPLSEAVERTFDGSHPCDLCHAVADGRKSEKKSEILPTVAKMDLICITRRLSWLPSWLPVVYATRSFYLSEIFLTPPAPPPRSLLS
jgi:hypothetical protein